MKKLIVFLSLLVFLLVIALPAFAKAPNGPSDKAHQKGDKHQLETLIKDSLKKNNGDLAKVKLDVDNFVAQKKVQREAKLQEMAKEKNISVDELKAQFKNKCQEKMSEKANKKGLTTDEMHKKMTEKHLERMDKMAKELGLTTEQLKQILPTHPAK